MKIIPHVICAAERGKNLSLEWGSHNHSGLSLLFAVSDKGLCWIGVNCTEQRLQEEWPHATLHENTKATLPYFQAFHQSYPASLKAFPLPVELYGTAFQIDVWRALLRIPCGCTLSYSQVAHNIGKPAAVRAVGTAVGKNPLSLLIPCHRVIHKSGDGLAYAWGSEIKRKLLAIEGVARL